MLSQTTTIAFILSSIAALLAAYCLWQIAVLNKLKKTFFNTGENLNLEQVILGLQKELTTGQKKQAALELLVTELTNNLSFAVQKVGMIRFNPFNDGGGNFSFSLALLDRHNSGVVITSMYGREQNRIYTKKIENGKCDLQLNEEEEQAIVLANKK